MRGFAAWDGSREVQAVDVYDPDQLPSLLEGATWHELPGACHDYMLALVAGEVATVSRALPVDVALAIARSERWAEAKAVRARKQEGGCDTPLGRVRTDLQSQGKIATFMAAAIAAQATGATFEPIGWTMADNGVVEHDTGALIAMGIAVTGHLNACQHASGAIRSLIDAAPDSAALAAIDITAGYPA